MSTDYISSATLKATLSLTGTTYADADIAAAITAASRAIDGITNRRFYADADANQVRYYSPIRASWLEIDDLATFTSLATDDNGDSTFAGTGWTLHTDFELDPLNAVADSKPWTALIVRPNTSRTLFPPFPRSVMLTGKFGWTAVPQEIADATSIIATQLVKRKKEAPFGAFALGPDGFAIRLARSDPQVCMLIDPLRRHWFAVA